MRRVGAWLLIGALAFGCLPGVAGAESEVEILLNALVENGTITGVQAGQIRRQISETKETRTKQLAKEIVPEPARTIAFGGDVRVRHEFRDRTVGQQSSNPDVTRERIRFRLGMDAKISDQLKVGARLATGSSTDPVSTNTNLGSGFNAKNIFLDRAFAAYTPEVPGLTETRLTAGRIENPFWTTDGMVWDDDLNFDGAAIRVAKDLSPVATVFTNNGLFTLQTDVTESASLWSTQGGVIVRPFANSEDELAKQWKVTGALAYYDYKNVTKPFSENNAFAQAGGSATTAPAAPTSAQLKGNTLEAEDFNLFNPTFELASQYAGIPFGLFTDWVRNTNGGDAGDNTGYLFGIRAGKASVPFSLAKGWEAGYYFERLPANAVFGPFTESDFGGGGTNHRGNVWWAKFAVLKNSAVQLKYFNTVEVNGAKNEFDTFQADWITKF